MHCPRCVEESKTSCVYPGSTHSNAAMFQRYFDEQGREHWHDPNALRTSYSCSNGHQFSLVASNKCGVEGCDYGHPASLVIHEHAR